LYFPAWINRLCVGAVNVGLPGESISKLHFTRKSLNIVAVLKGEDRIQAVYVIGC